MYRERRLLGKRFWELEKSCKRKIYGGLQRNVYILEQKKSDKKEDVNGNRKLFWKEVRKANGGKVESSNRIKD